MDQRIHENTQLSLQRRVHHLLHRRLKVPLSLLHDPSSRVHIVNREEAKL